MFVEEKSKPTLSQFRKRELVHSPFILMVFSILRSVFSVLLFSVLYMLGSVQPKASCVYSMNGVCVSCEKMAVFTK